MSRTSKAAAPARQDGPESKPSIKRSSLKPSGGGSASGKARTSAVTAETAAELPPSARRTRRTAGKTAKAARHAVPENTNTLPVARFIASGGIEDIARKILSDSVARHQELMEAMTRDNELSCAEKVNLLASLARSFNTTVEASRRVLPETGELAVALEVLNLLAVYVRDRSPESLPSLVDILDPFGLELVRHFQKKSAK